jgi:hypothetical protein
MQLRLGASRVVLFDLDDTLILATDLKKAVPIFQTHTGYATVIKVGSSHRLFVAIRPFAIASIVMLLKEGYKVGFWSAGSPPYVAAIVQRLVDAVRLMQAKKSKARNMLSFNPFTPLAVISLDHETLNWVRHPAMEEAAAEQAQAMEVLYKVDDSNITKYMARIADKHPALKPHFPNIILVDNLPQDPEHTYHIAEFTHIPKGSTPDKTLLNFARQVITSKESD